MFPDAINFHNSRDLDSTEVNVLVSRILGGLTGYTRGSRKLLLSLDESVPQCDPPQSQSLQPTVTFKGILGKCVLKGVS